MKKILGLDLGANSIGWAIVNEAEHPDELSSIIATGVRPVPLTVDEKNNFDKGKAITTNADRRLKRGMRRNLQRYKLRRDALKEILKENNFISENTLLSEHGNFSTFNTYELRAKSVTEKVSLEDLARILLMINKKRGYKSSRRTNKDEEGTLINSMDLAIEMYENNLTPGEVCLKMLQNGKKKLPEFYRSDLQREFDLVWDQQRQYYPQIMTDTLKSELAGRNGKQTWAILSRAFVWEEERKKWNGEEAKSEVVKATRTIEGIKRNTKGSDLKLENYSWRVEGKKQKLDPERLVIVLQEINAQIDSSSGYLGNISDRSKELYFNHKTVGQYLWDIISNHPGQSLKNTVFYRQDYLDEFNAIWDNQAKFHPQLTPELKHEIRDVVIFYQRRLKSQKGLISICELEQRQIVLERNGKKITKTVGTKVIPKSHPLYQEFRIWQTLNNIEVFVKDTKKPKKKASAIASLFDETEDKLALFGRRSLYVEEMQTLANELKVKDHLTKVEIINLLFDGRKDLDLNYDKVLGDVTMHSLYKAYSDMLEAYGGYEPIDFKRRADEIVGYVKDIFSSVGWNTAALSWGEYASIKDIEKSPAYKIWHLLYSYEGDDTPTGNGKLIEKLGIILNASKEYASILSNVTFEVDYGNLSAKAISRIMPFLKEGNTYDQACVYAGYNHSRQSITKEENDSRQLKQKLDILPKNSLRNPVVEKVLNQMVNVINALGDAYGNKDAKDGPFDEIRVELARELKKNAKEREEMSKAINDNDKENQKIRELLQKEFGLQHVSRNDIIRYKLYMELEGNGFHTLYSNTYIPREKLFSKEIDIEHIIPKACLFDDSLSNKTLEYKDVNLKKGKLTAWDFVKQTYGDESLAAYENRCNLIFKDKKGKLKKLLMSATDIPEGFIDRDLRNTQYIARMALNMLREICRSVVATTGSITDRLRQDWQLVDVLKEITLPKYESLGLVETRITPDGKIIKDIQDWTKRNDHRHHAMDALTVAFTRPVFIQFYNYINAQWDEKSKLHSNIIAIRNKYFEKGIAIPPMPLGELRASAKNHLERILVSLKAKNKVTTKSINRINTSKGIIATTQSTPRGALHKETIYGVRKRYVKTWETVNGSFDEEKIASVCSKKIKDALLARLAANGGDPKKAFTGKNALKKNPIFIDESKQLCVPEKVATVALEQYRTIRKPIDEKLSLALVIDAAIRKILQKRLDDFGNDAKKAFSNLEDNPILFNGKPIKRVTIDAKVDTGIYLHEKRDKDGKIMVDNEGHPLAADFAKSDVNHHIAIFRRPKFDKFGNQMHDEKGDALYEWMEHVVPFIEAVTRQNASLPVVDKYYKKEEGWEFVFSMKKNEYFVFPNPSTGFDPESIDLLNPEKASLISPNLFRAQALSSKYYVFRHHLETKVDVPKPLKDITWKRIVTIEGLKGAVKVRINHIGNIVSVGEY